MKREGNLSSLTDGKLYRSSDMARPGCNDCEGCSACCRGMGNSVVDGTMLPVCRCSQSTTYCPAAKSFLSNLVVEDKKMKKNAKNSNFLLQKLYQTNIIKHHSDI